MKLDKLLVKGFKSFGDRTEFDFNEGITCIVGPNGCGKSNVVDAVKWVLGEQSFKNLRGGSMEDVIFNGSSTRKPAGLAMVTLVFDNSEGRLKPLVEIDDDEHYNEIAVSRRLYRSGRSDYLLNNRPVRLRDIKEMFLDTGIGSNAYSIIEQGRIHSLLQASMDERRQFFDEAAGICLYKVRKAESLRKLERVEQNLLRLTDIIGEVEKRLRSIKYQAGKARNYQKYSERLKELKSLFFLSRYHRLKDGRGELQSHLDSKKDTVAAARGKLEQLGSARKGAEAELVELRRHVEEIRTRETNLRSRISSLRERIEIQSSNNKKLSEHIVINASRCEEFEAKVAEQAEELRTHESERAEIERGIVERDGECARLGDARDAKAGALIAVNTRIEEERAAADELSRRIENARAELQEIAVKRETLDPEQQRLSLEAERLDGDMAACDRRREIFTERKNKITTSAESIESLIEQVTIESAKAADNESSLGRRIAETREERSSLQGRINTLREMQSHFEGLAEGTRRLLRAKREGRVDAICGVLGDYIDTDVEHAVVVEAALAGAEQKLITPNLAILEREADEIRKIAGNNGYVDIICLDRILDAGRDEVPVPVPIANGRLLDMVLFEPWLAPLMNVLLGRTLVVKSLTDAAVAAESVTGDYQFVTVDGDLLMPDGTVRIGGGRGPAGIISRRSELKKLIGASARMESHIARLEEEYRQTRRRMEEIEKRLNESWNKKYRLSRIRDVVSRKIRGAGEKKEELADGKTHVERRLREVRDTLENVSRRENEVGARLDELEAEQTQRDGLLRGMVVKASTIQEELDALDERYNEVRVELASHRQKKVGCENYIASARRRIEELEAQCSAARADIASDRKRKAEVQAEIEQATGRLKEFEEEQNNFEQEIRETEESCSGINERIGQIEDKQARERTSIEEINEKINAVSVKIAEIDAHISDLINRAADEMSMDLVSCYRRYDHDNDRDWDEVESEINELRGKIKRLGNINLDALSEQEELEKRHEFLSSQIDDVNTSRRELEKLIDKLNAESINLFIATFKQVRENFQAYFRKLFGGGKADIYLQDEENVLESGIEIVARPPGKELRSIAQLSGGEKSLAAAALIFSFFNANPSPFCLLDEVDAALDEANIDRFCEIVKQFSIDTQIILVTHSKRTMSIANVLYGVTMQDPGVSKRISVRFEEAEKLTDTPEKAQRVEAVS